MNKAVGYLVYESVFAVFERWGVGGWWDAHKVATSVASAFDSSFPE